MKVCLYFSLSFAIGLLFFSSCKKEELPAESSIIIYSFGFDDDTSASFDGWTSSSYSLVNDVPPNGGTWALQLQPQTPPGEGLAETDVSFLSSGTINVKLSADTKLTNPGTGWLRLLLQHSSGGRDSLASAPFTNTSWQNISVSASANIASGDKMIIQLSAGSAGLATWNALFDNVELDKQ
jgi:hypothetical protein